MGLCEYMHIILGYYGFGLPVVPSGGVLTILDSLRSLRECAEKLTTGLPRSSQPEKKINLPFAFG